MKFNFLSRDLGLSGMIFIIRTTNQSALIALHPAFNPSMRVLCILSLLLLLIGVNSLSAQNDSLKKVLTALSPNKIASDTNSINPQLSGVGKVTIQADSSIIRLEKSTRKFKDIKGYRIQIFLGSIDQAKSERNKYLSFGLPYSIYAKQIVPEQALQLGDFISRMDMEKHLQIIQKYYPKAFGVVDFIEPPKFGSSRK